MGTEDVRGEESELTREAQDAGLIVKLIRPHRCGSHIEYHISLWCPDGRLWAEGTHETADQIRGQHIAGWRARAGAG